MKKFEPLSFVRTIALSIVIGILTASNVLGQNLDRRVDIKANDIPLSAVLQILELKTKFTFSYLNKELPLNERVTLDVKDEPLRQILEILSKRFALTFTRIDNIITVKRKEGPHGENISNGVGTLRGIVRDSVTSEVLPFASVYVPEIRNGASTDGRGFFLIPSIPANNRCRIVVTYVGYRPKVITVSIKRNEITDVNISLARSAVQVDSVVVYGERMNEGGVSVEKLSAREIENMTHGVETDVMRSIQLEPGVQSVGDVSARYYVRGGASDENLVLLNGTPIYNPFHALGMFSVIDPDMINSVEFYKGGFDAKYGGRLSSVLNIITKDGNRNSFGATAALSELTFRTALEGPIPDGSFILTGRKCYSSEILKEFTNGNNIPIDFYDASFKVNYSNPQFLPISKFTLFGFTSNDDINYKSMLHASYNWSNSNVGFNWFMATQNSPLFAKLTMYYANFSGGEIPNSTDAQHIENRLDNLAFKTDFDYTFNDRNEFYGGLLINYIKTHLLLSNSSGQLKDMGSEATAFGGYIGIKLSSINKLKADLGSRLNVMRLSEAPGLFAEPRVNVVYSLSPTLNLKAAWGLYQQELVTISDEDEVLPLFEPWIITPSYLKPSNAIHYIVGFDYYPTSRLKVDVEGYYKLEHNLAVVNDSLIYPTDHQLIPASGESHGAEISMDYKTGWIYAQLSYAYSWTTRKIWDIVYHPRYDIRNAVKFFADAELGDNWSASMSWAFDSGMPFTQILGYYNKFNPLDILNPSSALTNYFYFPILAGRNAARLPDYHRLDVGISKEIKISAVKVHIDLDVINVYDRKNFFYYDFKTGERVNMLPFFPTIDIKAEI